MAQTAKKRQRERKTTTRCDVHHLIWIRKKWSCGYARALRNHWYFRVPLPKQTLHARIHEEMAGIPVPSGVHAKAAYEQIKMLEQKGVLHDNDPAEKRLTLLAALFDCVAQPTADAFRTEAQIISKFYQNHAR